ncbi:MAG: phosphoribosylamine--glycine ligase [Acidobacteria bacterium]|nr:phosphoribosylamine--glycine ligase [Acidobacteriota bacterium]
MVGSGAREHALAWGLAKTAEVVVTPGNAGIAAHGITCVETPAAELDADLFVIGPELPLTQGLADQLRAQGKSVLGPGRDGARLEASKAFMKQFLHDAGVPTARFGVFDRPEEALDFLVTMAPPYVIKTDGLAAGKGVLVTDDFEEACADVLDKLSGNAFGHAGTTIVIEEGLDGEECSLLVLCDGVRAVALVPAQDFKRVGDGDTGANTGGMGAFAPMASMSDTDVDEVMTRIVAPTLRELRRRGIDFRGVLYAGVMMSSRGPQLLEYNVRFGDPETEALVPLYGDSLVALLSAVAAGTLDAVPATTGQSAVTVVLSASGYPESARHGDVISGLGDDGQLASPLEGVVVFHAGTSRDAQGRFVTHGGRVLAVSAVADTLAEARERAYAACAAITFDGRVMRHDIARAASQGAT